MKIFIDSAVVEEISEAESWGIIDGVTTNPSLIAKSGRDFKEVIQENCKETEVRVHSKCTCVYLNT